MLDLDTHSTPRAKSIFRKAAHRLLHRSSVDSEAVAVAVIRQSGMFDANWYLQRYADVAGIGMDPIVHYVRHGASEARNPNATFNTAYYLQHNLDVAAAGMNPFRHYVEYGLKEGRAIHAEVRHDSSDAGSDTAVSPQASDAEIIAGSGIFDRDYYLGNYPSVANACVDPVVHYVKYGAKEGRNPCALFDTKYYMVNNPDVTASGMNPLVHFCEFGRWELRNPSPAFDSVWYWLTYLAGSDSESNPLEHYMSAGQKMAMDIRAADKLSKEDKQSLVEICQELLQRENHSAGAATRIGIALSRLSRWAEAEKAFRDAAALEWNNPHAHERLARALGRQGKWWQAVESLERATELDPIRAGWLFRLGEAQEKMNRFSQAVDSYQRAVDLDARHAGWHYQLGYAYEKTGQPERAEYAYAKALKLDKRADVKRFGVGMLHQLRGYWPEAAAAYGDLLARNPLDAALHFKYGMAQDRCYSWPMAEDAYRVAIALDPDVPYWHYRYGFVLERQQRWLEAAEAYAAAALLSPKRMPYWHYRCGYVLDQAGAYEQACLAYLQTRENQTLSGGLYEAVLLSEDIEGSAVALQDPAKLGRSDGHATELLVSPKPKQSAAAAPRKIDTYLARFPSSAVIQRAIEHDTTDPHRHYRLGEVCERQQDWTGAATAYADAVARSDPHRPAWHYRLGFVLFRDGQFAAAADAFRETRILRRAFGVDMAKFEGTDTQSKLAAYNEYVSTLPVLERVVIYESLHGATVGGNPYAIFEQLLGDSRFANWRHVWVVNNRSVIPRALCSRSDVVFVLRDSELYRRYVATASHLINDVTFPFWFTCRAEQKYLNTWHGTPLKSMGKEIPGEFMAHGNIQRNFLQATHIISPNPHTSDVLMRCYDVHGIYGGKLAELGYPRIDRTLRATEERMNGVRERLGLDPQRPVVLYAPTWRGEHGHAEFDVERLINDIKRLSTQMCQFVFRGHHMIERLIESAQINVVLAPQELDTSDVLAITDVLITDYSSIAFDFLPMRRPILYYCYDSKAYSDSRGFCLDIDSMPGVICRDLNALDKALGQHLGKAETLNEDAYTKAIETYCAEEDGFASERAVAFFFDDDDSHRVDRYEDTRRSLLFFNGHFPTNGITASFLNLMENLCNANGDQITVAIEPRRIESQPAWREKFDSLPDRIKVHSRVGSLVQSPEERWVADSFGKQREFAGVEMRNVFRGAYQREYIRIFGRAKIDALINFEGYNGFWTTLFGMGSNDLPKAAYLHNDMVEEFQLKHVYLKAMFEVYHDYDKLLSVSEGMALVNQRKMSRMFGLAPSKFLGCVNSINVSQIIESANAEVDEDLLDWFDKGPVFFTMGRMSPEKDHAKLLSAFSRVNVQYPCARLLIAGDGPLHPALIIQIKELGLESAVCLAGQRRNPFPLLRRCDCFVLPSNHEGQPMVLLEAMTLGRPIVATDIDGNRAVLEGGYGELVENTAAGLEAGMVAFLDGRIQCKRFDAQDYAQKAIDMFNEVVMDARSDRVAAEPLDGSTQSQVVASRPTGAMEAQKDEPADQR